MGTGAATEDGGPGLIRGAVRRWRAARPLAPGSPGRGELAKPGRLLADAGGEVGVEVGDGVAELFELGGDLVGGGVEVGEGGVGEGHAVLQVGESPMDGAVDAVLQAQRVEQAHAGAQARGPKKPTFTPDVPSRAEGFGSLLSTGRLMLLPSIWSMSPVLMRRDFSKPGWSEPGVLLSCLAMTELISSRRGSWN